MDGIDLAIMPGEFYGLLGPNGAGKTTTIKMIVGLLRPDEGRAGIGDIDTWEHPTEAKRLIGVLPEEFNLYERLTGAELIEFTAAIHGVPRAEAAARRDELLSLLALEADAKKVIGDYSRGMRKKVALAAAVIHAPPVLFLDEPFEGVDAISARLIRRLLQRYTERGATVVFSSHVMELVEKLCTRIGIMTNGRLEVEATPAKLLADYGVTNIEDAFLKAVGADDPDGGVGVVGRLIWLKWRLLVNGLRTDRSRRIGLPVVVAAIVALAYVVGRAVLETARSLPDGLVGSYSIWVAAIGTVAWATLPVIIFPVDESLDPAKFDTLPLSPDPVDRWLGRGRIGHATHPGARHPLLTQLRHLRRAGGRTLRPGRICDLRASGRRRRSGIHQPRSPSW